jgi:hypothetical protein
VFQDRAVQKFHGDEPLLAALADLVDGANIGVVESGACARLAAKAFEVWRPFRQSAGKNLTATKRPSSVSSALQITPRPPPPSLSTMR